MHLNESLNLPYKFHKLRSQDDRGFYSYGFKTSNGLEYAVDIFNYEVGKRTDFKKFEVVFYITDGTDDENALEQLDKTGTRDEFRVFATISDIVQRFIKKYSPETIRFSADKKEGTGRIALYRRFAKGLVKMYNAKLIQSRPDSGHFMINFLSEDLQDFRSFRNELKPLNDMSTTVHRDKAFNLATILASKYGYKPVGKGAKATVFEKPGTNEVLKFFLQDSAYARWVKFCLANQGNPFIPKLRGKIKTFQKPWYYIRMENLEPVYDDSANKLLSVIGGMQMELDEYPLEDHMERAKPPASYLWPIANIFNRNEKILDLHDGNIMKRSNGQLVIVDPFYNFYRTKDNQYTIDPEHE